MIRWMYPWSGMLAGVVVTNVLIFRFIWDRDWLNSIAVGLCAGTVFVLLVGIYELIKAYTK
jgi:hypothetical protein